MFLTVPATIEGVDRPSESQRAELARRLSRIVTRDYDGVKMDAYRAADVNSQTLDNALAGHPIAPRTLVKIMKTFWPATEGDWTRLGLGDSDMEDLGDVADLSAIAVAQILAAIREELLTTGEVSRTRYIEMVQAAQQDDFALAANESDGDPLQQEPGAEEGPST